MTGMENGEAFCWMARRDEAAGLPPRPRSNEASRQKGRRPQGLAAAAPAKPLGSGAKSSQDFPLRGFSTGSKISAWLGGNACGAGQDRREAPAKGLRPSRSVLG